MNSWQPIEPLEARIAPATLVKPNIVTFTDVDGDLVSVKITKGSFDLLANFVFTPSGDGEQLQLISIRDAQFDGASLTITAKRQSNAGDGFVNVGAIDARGINLGTVKVGGDLGQIDVGNNSATKAALKKLDIRSLGELGTSTQIDGADLVSNVRGLLSSVNILGNVREAYLHAVGSNAKIGKVVIGGSIIGGAEEFSGRVDSEGDFLSILVKGDLIGGSARDSGTIDSDAKIGKVTILGSVIGGDGNDSGQIDGDDGIGSVKIVGDLVGGAGNESGVVNGDAGLGVVIIGGSMIGAGGEESGSVMAEGDGAAIKSVKLGRDIIGGDGDESAYIHADRSLGPVTVGGSVIGGDGIISGTVYAGNLIAVNTSMKSVKVGGNVIGGTGNGSGAIGAALGIAGTLAGVQIGKVTVNGSLIGEGPNSGTISGRSAISVFVGGDVMGNEASSGKIQMGDFVTKLTIAGSVTGGAGPESGVILSDTAGAIKIGRDLRGGSGMNSGSVIIFGSEMKSLTVGGSVVSAGPSSGGVSVNGIVGSITIGRDVDGSPASPVLFAVRGVDGMASPLAIGKLTIKGSAEFLEVLGGTTVFAVSPLNGDASFGKISIGGDLIASSIVVGFARGADGSFGTNDDEAIAASNTAAPARIASIVVNGQVLGTPGGGDSYGLLADEIGSLKVGKVKYPLTSGTDSFPIGSNDDVVVREGLP